MGPRRENSSQRNAKERQILATWILIYIFFLGGGGDFSLEDNVSDQSQQLLTF